MKNNIKLLLLFCLPSFAITASKPQEQVNKEMLAQHREMFEQIITELTNQVQQNGLFIQSLIGTLQTDKIKCSEQQKITFFKELQEFQGITQLLLENLKLINPEWIQIALIHNIALSDYLLKAVKKDILSINIKDFHIAVDRESANFNPENLDLILQKNQEKINQLMVLTGSIGKTWYNKTYNFLNDWHTGSIIKGLTKLSLTSLSGYLLYKMINPSESDPSWVKNIVGKPGKKILGEDGTLSQDPNNPATGIHKLGFLSVPLTTYFINKVIDDVKPYETVKGMYAPWYNNAKYQASLGMNKVDNFLAGKTDDKNPVGDYEKVYFKDMTGVEHLEELAKKIANFMKHPERYERVGIEEHRGILLYGPPQTGKTLFAKALRTYIQEEMGDGQKMNFVDAKALMDIQGISIEEIFYRANTFWAPCIIFFDEIDLFGAHREKNALNTGQLLTGMQGIDPSKKVFVIGATNKPEQLDKALLVDGRFGKMIYVDYPRYNNRKSFLEGQLAARNIKLEEEFIDHIAQETEGCSYNNLKRLISESIILSGIELKPVSAEHFERVLDAEIRKIQPEKTMSQNEKLVISTYQAGKALIRHILQTNKHIVKITTNPVMKNVKAIDLIAIKTESDSNNEKLAEDKKEQKLKYGEVFTKASSDHLELIGDDDLENECIALFAGGVCLKHIFNKTFTNLNPQDHAEAMKLIYNLISHGEKVDDKIKEQALQIKADYEKKALALLQNNHELLQKIIDTLMQQGTLDRHEWKALVEHEPVVTA